jgi:hypothetical protein
MSDLSVRQPPRASNADAIEQILVALQHLIDTTTRPIVRGCLEDAHEDIPHLTSHHAGMAEGDDFPTAA